jgi:hypothetical protein
MKIRIIFQNEIKIFLSMEIILKWNNIIFIFNLTATWAPFNCYRHHHHLWHCNAATTNATIIATATITAAANTATTAPANAAADAAASTPTSTAAANSTATTTQPSPPLPLHPLPMKIRITFQNGLKLFLSMESIG